MDWKMFVERKKAKSLLTETRKKMAKHFLWFSVVLSLFLISLSIKDFVDFAVSSKHIAFFAVRLLYLLNSILFYCALLYLFANGVIKSIQKRGALLFSIFVFTITLFCAQFGIDMTDDGFNSSIAWFFVKDGLQRSSNFYYILSTILNGFWLNLMPEPFLFWNRIGATLMITVEFSLLYRMFQKQIQKDPVVLFGLILSWALFLGLRGGPEIALNYSTTPAFLCTIFIYLLYLGEKKERAFLPIFLSGFFMLVVAASRIPLFLMVFSPLLFYWISERRKNGNGKFLFKAGAFYGGFLAGGIVLLTLVLCHPHLRNVFFTIINDLVSLVWKAKPVTSGVASAYVGGGTVTYFQFLLELYFFGFSVICMGSVFWLFILKGGDQFLSLIRSEKMQSICLYIFFPLFLLFFFGCLLAATWYYFLYGFILSIYLLIFLYGLPVKDLFFPLFWGAVWSICSIFGSNTGVKQMIMGAFLFMPAILLLARTEEKRLQQRGGQFFPKIILSIMAGLLLAAVYTKIFDVNLRDVSKIKMTSTVDDPFFAGIRTGKERAEGLTKIMKFMRSHLQQEDTILCFNSIPMFYYALDKNFILSDPWAVQIDSQDFLQQLQSLQKKDEIPDYLLFSIYSGREKNWPKTTVRGSKIEQENYEYFLQFVEETQYQEIYHDGSFIVYKKSSKEQDK